MGRGKATEPRSHGGLWSEGKSPLPAPSWLRASVPPWLPTVHPSGIATQNTSVLAIGFAARPVPMMSRMHPPMPVAAPP